MKKPIKKGNLVFQEYLKSLQFFALRKQTDHISLHSPFDASCVPTIQLLLLLLLGYVVVVDQIPSSSCLVPATPRRRLTAQTGFFHSGTGGKWAMRRERRRGEWTFCAYSAVRSEAWVRSGGEG